jgi:hypothetical protein
MKSDNYLQVLFQIVDEKMESEPESETREVKKIISEIVNAENEYEFNEERQKIQSILRSHIR